MLHTFASNEAMLSLAPPMATTCPARYSLAFDVTALLILKVILDAGVSLRLRRGSHVRYSLDGSCHPTRAGYFAQQSGL